ncbi:hypothetical protein A4A49_43077, partial [Nicotiana attenuata]
TEDTKEKEAEENQERSFTQGDPNPPPIVFFINLQRKLQPLNLIAATKLQPAPNSFASPPLPIFLTSPDEKQHTLRERAEKQQRQKWSSELPLRSPVAGSVRSHRRKFRSVIYSCCSSS